MADAFLRKPAEVLAQYGVRADEGLTPEQVEASRAKHGRNGVARCPTRLLASRDLFSPSSTSTPYARDWRRRDAGEGGHATVEAHPGAVRR